MYLVDGVHGHMIRVAIIENRIICIINCGPVKCQRLAAGAGPGAGGGREKAANLDAIII